MNRALLDQKRSEAASRRSERASRTPEEQIARLDMLLGVGQGAVAERARLQRLIDAPNIVKEIFEKPSTPKKGRQPKGKKARS